MKRDQFSKLAFSAFIPLLLLLSFSMHANSDEPVPAEEVDFDSLGGNRIILERARALEPDKKVSIVQNRHVDRRRRVELAPEMSGTFGGEAYTQTRALSLNAYYHFTPKISVGFKYGHMFNDLTPEGEAAYQRAQASYQRNPARPESPFPEIDERKSEMLAMANWYPFYGKLNIFERSVTHFDLYALGGAGQVTLRSGTSDTYTAGGGIGFWFTQHFSTRAEMRYQTYTAKYLSGDRQLDLTIASVQMGWLL